MAQSPASPEHDPTTPVPPSEPASEAAQGDVVASDGPADLEAVLAAALDEDDLPDPHPPAPTPTLEAATARPTVGAYGASEAATPPAAVGSYGTPEEATPAAVVGSYGTPEEATPPAAGGSGSSSEEAASPAVGGAFYGSADAASPARSETGAPGEPSVATTLEVAPLSVGQAGATGGAEGGEWELLIGKVKAWFEQADLPGQWERLGGPLRGLGLLLAGLLVIKLYVALLDTLDDVPLLPRLLQLVGLFALLNFSLTRLTRKSDRQVILEDWKRRWDAFRGS